jgi:hypothetical protein
MPTSVTLDGPVAKKKPVVEGGGPKQYGTLIRVSDEFAEAIRQASSFDAVSMREFADLHLLPAVRKHYRDAVLREAKRIGGTD